MSKYGEQVKQDAAKAAAYIREHGWCQGHYRNNNGECCAAGAMNMTINYHPDEPPTDDNSWHRWISIRTAFREEVGGETIAWYNDRPGRTKEEVLAVFDRIANF